MSLPELDCPRGLRCPLVRQLLDEIASELGRRTEAENTRILVDWLRARGAHDLADAHETPGKLADWVARKLGESTSAFLDLDREERTSPSPVATDL